MPEESISEDASIRHSAVPNLGSHRAHVAAHARQHAFLSNCLDPFEGQHMWPHDFHERSMAADATITAYQKHKLQSLTIDLHKDRGRRPPVHPCGPRLNSFWRARARSRARLRCLRELHSLVQAMFLQASWWFSWSASIQKNFSCRCTPYVGAELHRSGHR